MGLDGGSYSTYVYALSNPLSRTDRFGLAIGDFPPPPPGYDPWAWDQGQWSNGRFWLRDPDGNVYTIHPEDPGHWRHWDKQDKNGNDGGQCPPNSGKKRPELKKLKPNESTTDPNGDAPPWTPQDDFSQLPFPVIPITPLAPVPVTPSTAVPETVEPVFDPLFEPVFAPVL